MWTVKNCIGNGEWINLFTGNRKEAWSFYGIRSGRLVKEEGLVLIRDDGSFAANTYTYVSSGAIRKRAQRRKNRVVLISLEFGR